MLKNAGITEDVIMKVQEDVILVPREASGLD